MYLIDDDVVVWFQTQGRQWVDHHPVIGSYEQQQKASKRQARIAVLEDGDNREITKEQHKLIQKLFGNVTIQHNAVRLFVT